MQDAAGAPAAPAPSDKESGYRRLKRQRDDARAAFQQQAQATDQQNARMDRLERMLETMASGRGDSNQNQKTNDVSLGDLRKAAIDSNWVQENPAAANDAIFRYMDQTFGALEKKIEDSTSGLGESLAGQVETQVFGKLKAEREQESVRTQIRNDFGDIAFDQQSDLWKEADDVYRQLTGAHAARHGDTVSVPADYQRLAFLEAERRLKQGEPNAAESVPIPVPAPPGSPGIPPGSQIETTGEGTADAAASRQQMIESGDWEGSLGAKAREMYPET